MGIIGTSYGRAKFHTGWDICILLTRKGMERSVLPFKGKRRGGRVVLNMAEDLSQHSLNHSCIYVSCPHPQIWIWPDEGVEIARAVSGLDWGWKEATAISMPQDIFERDLLCWKQRWVHVSRTESAYVTHCYRQISILCFQNPNTFVLQALKWLRSYPLSTEWALRLKNKVRRYMKDKLRFPWVST